MAIPENSHRWSTISASGALKAYDCRGYAQGVTFGLETSSGCTATIQIQHRMGSSGGPYSVLSTVNMSTGAFTTDQFLGPLEWVRPRVTDITAGSTHVVTIYLKGN